MATEANPAFSLINLQTLANLVSQINQMQSNTIRNPATDPMNQSPYFLHPGENSGTALISTVLEHNNYQVWERAMWRALRGKNKIRFVDGTLPRPQLDDPLYEAWERCTSYVVSWINHSLSLNIAKSVLWINSAAELWKELKKRYCQGDMYKIAELEEEMFTSKQGDLSLTDYYTNLKTIWEELDNFRPVPVCSRCVDVCNCELSIMRDYREEAQVVRFLRELSDQFSTVRSQIMLMKLLPKLEDCIDNNALMVNAKNATGNSRTENSSGNSRNKNKGKWNQDKGGKNKKPCSYCGKLGHLVDVCYKKHGYPPGFKSNQGSINNVTAAEDDDDDNHSSQSQKEMDGRSEHYFTLEQREALLALLQQEISKHSVNQFTPPLSLQPKVLPTLCLYPLLAQPPG